MPRIKRRATLLPLLGLILLLSVAPIQASVHNIVQGCQDSWDSWNSSGNVVPPKPSRADELIAVLQKYFPKSTVDHIGTGGRGIIFRITHEDGNSVVVKFVLDINDQKAITALRREPKIFSKAQKADAEGSRHLVQITGDIEVKIKTWQDGLVMKDATEGSLDSHLAEFGPGRDPLEVLDAWRQIALGLRSLHRANLTHRDIKPENILMAREKDGTLTYMVGDTELAYEPGDYLPPGMVAGTPAYMGDDALRGETPNAKHDLHALNITFMEMLMGHSVYDLDYDKPANHVRAFALGPGRSLVPFLRQLPDHIAKDTNPHLRKIVETKFAKTEDLITAIDEAEARIKQEMADKAAKGPTPPPPAPKPGLFDWAWRLKELFWKSKTPANEASQPSGYDPVWYDPH